jgi:HD-GYP domain-containing protein (c-di-GMP phosphodiesterase class II)
VAELRANAGTQFDPHVVDTFVRLVAREGVGEMGERASASPRVVRPSGTMLAADAHYS